MSNYRRTTKLPVNYVLLLGMLLGIPIALPLGSYVIGLPIGLIVAFMVAIISDRVLATRKR